MSAGPSNRRSFPGLTDPESLERENSQELEQLASKASYLKQVTQSIRDEVDSQHLLLDNMGTNMTSAQTGLGGAVGKFKTVMADKQNRKMFTIVVGILVAFFLFWLTFKK